VLYAGQEVGSITSAAHLPDTDSIVALAYVDADAVGSDAQLAVIAGGALLAVLYLRASIRDGRGRRA